MDNFLRHNFNQRYVVFDTETEGLNLVTSQTWQLSWLVAKGRKIESIHDHYLAWPDLNVGKDAARVTGFSKSEYIRRREDPYHVMSMFLKDTEREDTIVAAHNFFKFDCYMINIIRRALGLSTDYSWLDRSLDTNALAVAVKKGLQPPSGNYDRLAWQFKLAHVRESGLRTNMGAMLKHFDIEYDKSKLHDAKYDITKNFELLHETLKVIDL